MVYTVSKKETDEITISATVQPYHRSDNSHRSKLFLRNILKLNLKSRCSFTVRKKKVDALFISRDNRAPASDRVIT